MLVRWRCRSRNAVVLTALVYQFADASSAVAAKIVIDPGHGGSDNGIQGTSTCYEKTMDLWSALKVADLFNGSPTYVVLLTRPDDSPRTDFQRREFAEGHDAEAFVSVHHENPRIDVGFNNCTTAGIYSTAPFGGIPDRYLAGVLATEVNAELLGWFPDFGLAQAGAVLNASYLDCPGCYTPELPEQVPVRARISAFGAGCPDGWASCQFGNLITLAEANGIVNGLALYFYNPAPNRGFAVIGDVTYYVSFEWFEWSGGIVTYSLERSDNCWGPFEHIKDVTTEPNRVYYRDVDDTVSYARGAEAPYYYRLIRTNQIYTVTATTSNLPPPPSPPSAPSNLVCVWNGNGYKLSWTPSQGNVTGYRIIRGAGAGPSGHLTDCSKTHTFVGTTPSTTYVDGAASAGGYYRVMAYNAGGNSAVSNEAYGDYPTDSPIESEPPSVDRSAGARLFVDSNGGGFAFYVPAVDRATIAVYDVRGRLVATAFSGAVVAGTTHVAWANRAGRTRVPSGVYIARLYTNSQPPVTKKFVMVR